MQVLFVKRKAHLLNLGSEYFALEYLDIGLDYPDQSGLSRPVWIIQASLDLEYLD